MKDITKYQGVIPAFYACYDQDGNISVESVKALTRHLISKGVKGVYVGGSSGECIYQHVDERKKVLEAVMEEAKGKLTVIAHVGCNNTADSVELAAHCIHSSHLLPLTGICHCRVLERNERCCPGAGFCHLQYPPACRNCFIHEPVKGNVEKSQCYRCKELFYAHPGHPAVQGRRCPPAW